MGLPEYYEHYKKGKLEEREAYVYQQGDPKTLSMVTIFTRESEKKHKVEYNKYGNLKSWEFYGTNGKLFSKTRFEYIYDEQGNWTELKIIQDNGKVKVKVEKTIEYRS